MDVTLARNLRDRIRRFNDDCERSGETDTGEAWEILTDIEEYLADVVKSHGPPADGERGVNVDPEYDPSEVWFTVASRPTDPDGAVSLRYDDGRTAMYVYRDAHECVNAASDLDHYAVDVTGERIGKGTRVGMYVDDDDVGVGDDGGFRFGRVLAMDPDAPGSALVKWEDDSSVESVEPFALVVAPV